MSNYVRINTNQRTHITKKYDNRIGELVGTAFEVRDSGMSDLVHIVRFTNNKKLGSSIWPMIWVYDMEIKDYNPSQSEIEEEYGE